MTAIGSANDASRSEITSFFLMGSPSYEGSLANVRRSSKAASKSSSFAMLHLHFSKHGFRGKKPNPPPNGAWVRRRKTKFSRLAQFLQNFLLENPNKY
jgi:hypothetical protein